MIRKPNKSRDHLLRLLRSFELYIIVTICILFDHVMFETIIKEKSLHFLVYNCFNKMKIYILWFKIALIYNKHRESGNKLKWTQEILFINYFENNHKVKGIK